MNPPGDLAESLSNFFKYQPEELHEAVINYDLNKIKSLLSSGHDINSRDSLGRTPLNLAAIHNSNNSHDCSLEWLLKNHANVNAQDEEGKTALHSLVENRSGVLVVELVLNFGANVGATNDLGEIPLISAMRDGNLEVARLLLDYGSDVNCPSPRDNSTPLHIAKRLHSDKMTECLLKFGANVNAVDSKGSMPLTYLFEREPTRTSIWYFKQRPNLRTIVLEHIAKLQSLEFPVDPSYLKYISRNTFYRNYYQKCLEDLSKAKGVKLKNSWITFFDLLVECERKIKNYAGNQEIMTDFQGSKCEEKFPIYGTEMIENVKMGMRRRELFDESSILLSDCLPIFNPNHLIIRDVLDCTITRHLLKFCEKDSFCFYNDTSGYEYIKPKISARDYYKNLKR